MQTFRNNYRTDYVYVLLIILMVLQILIGIFIVGFNEYYKRSLSKHVGQLEKEQIYFQFSIAEIYGFHIIISYVCGFPLLRKCRNDPYTIHLGMLLKIWHIFIFIVSIDGFILSSFISNDKSSLEKSIELSLFRGIEIYYSNPDWRLIWDDMQYFKECCGVYSYKDWQTTAWIEEYSIEDINNNENDERQRTSLLSLTPYSCCRKGVGCFENYIPHKISHVWMELPTLNISGINENGCLTFFNKDIELTSLIQWIISAVIFIFENYGCADSSNLQYDETDSPPETGRINESYDDEFQEEIRKCHCKRQVVFTDGNVEQEPVPFVKH